MVANVTRYSLLPGFTLAELLIALAILGVIATFTIPKVLSAQSDAKNNAIVKEVAATMSGAYQAYRMENSNPYVSTLDLTPYMNYVSVRTTGTVDLEPTRGIDNCGTGVYCLQLHNGATVAYYEDSFCQTNNRTGFKMIIDPDGLGDGKVQAVGIWLYNNGLIRTNATIEGLTEWGWESGTSTCVLSGGTDESSEPDWFHWN